MITEIQSLNVYVGGVRQRWVTNVAVVNNDKGTFFILRGALKADADDLAWLDETHVGDDEILVVVANQDGLERQARCELLRKTIGQNAQGKGPFWHVRFVVKRFV